MQQKGRPVVEFVQVLALQRVLALGIALPSTDGKVLRGLQKERGSRHRRQLAAKTVDHIVGTYVGTGLPKMKIGALAALLERLQHDEEPALIRNRVSSGEADDRVHRRIAHHN